MAPSLGVREPMTDCTTVPPLSPRSPDHRTIVGLAEAYASEKSIEMFRRMCLSRANEITLRQLHRNGQIECLVYLSVGQEAVAPGLSMAMPGAWVLGQHRCHALYLSFGGDHRLMIDEMLGLPSGSTRGLGGSPTLQNFANGIRSESGSETQP